MNQTPAPATTTSERRKAPLWRELWVQVLVAIVLGAAVGWGLPKLGVQLQPFADAFIKLIRMLLAPIVFGTVVTGVAKMGSFKEVGRIGVKALLWFEAASTVALLIGLVAVDLIRPGAGMNIDPHSLDAAAVAKYQTVAHSQSVSGFLLNIIPDTFFGAFSSGAMLQVILLAVLFGAALLHVGPRARPLVELVDLVLDVLFRIVGMVMRLAPIGAGAGMAYTIGKYGPGVLWRLGDLILVVYATAILFVLLVLGGAMRALRLPLAGLLRYIKTEILVTFGSCSTEAVLPQMMQKLEAIGCEKSVVGMVLPTGYTFNADGTCIYLAAAAIFVGQATNTPLGLLDQVILLAVLLLTSKGSAGVAGAGFVTLAATLSTVHSVPVVGLVLLLGVDRFLNQARAVVNLIGNAVGVILVARWDGALDQAQAKAVLAARPAASE